MKNLFITYFFLSSFFYMHLAAHFGLSNPPEPLALHTLPSVIIEKIGHYLIEFSDFKSFYSFITTAKKGIKDQFNEKSLQMIDQQFIQKRQENSLKMKNFLAINDRHICIIQPDDLVQCMDWYTREKHIPIDLGPVVSITQTCEGFCAITKENHGVKCWVSNSSDDLKWIPFVVFEKGIKSIIISGINFYLVKEDDMILHWRFANTLTPDYLEDRPPEIIKIGPIKEISIQNSTICVTDPVQHFVRCLESNQPSVAISIPDIGAVISFDEKDNNAWRQGGYTCAIKEEDQQVYCWQGWPRYSNHPWSLGKNNPKRIPFEMEPIQKVFLRDDHIFAIRKKDQLLQYWYAYQPTVAPILFSDIGAVIDVIIIDDGNQNAFCAILKKDGAVHCMLYGDSFYNPLQTTITPFGEKPVYAIHKDHCNRLCAISYEDHATVMCSAIHEFEDRYYFFSPIVAHPPLETKFPSTAEEWMAAFNVFLSLK